MKKKFLVLIGIGLAVATLLGGCGKKTGNNEEIGKTISEYQESDEIKVYGLKDALERKERQIWYVIDGDDGVFGKESNVEDAFVFEDGKVTYYDFGGIFSLNFGELAKLDDDEIVSKLKEADLNKAEELRQYCIKDLESSHFDYDGTDAEWKQFEETLAQQHAEALDYVNSQTVVGTQPGLFDLQIKTDATGNYTQTEILYCSYKADKYPNTVSLEEPVDGRYYIIPKGEYDVANFPLIEMHSTVQVYDAQYNGYFVARTDGTIDENSNIFITKIKDESFIFDEPGTDGIDIDLSDEEESELEEKLCSSSENAK